MSAPALWRSTLTGNFISAEDAAADPAHAVRESDDFAAAWYAAHADSALAANQANLQVQLDSRNALLRRALVLLQADPGTQEWKGQAKDLVADIGALP